MNLHEECLLKYLLDSDNLFQMTDILNFNNEILAGNNIVQDCTKILNLGIKTN